MVSLRWLDGIVRCPICGSEKVAYLEKSQLYYCSTSIRARSSRSRSEQFLRILLSVWTSGFRQCGYCANCKNGISSYELAKAIGVTQKSAWFMLHRIRVAMKKG